MIRIERTSAYKIMLFSAAVVAIAFLTAFLFEKTPIKRNLTIVFVPGLSFTPKIWKSLTESTTLQQLATMEIIDLRKIIPRQSERAEVAQRLQEKLSKYQNVVLVGWSLGGLVLLDFLEFGDTRNIKGLIFISGISDGAMNPLGEKSVSPDFFSDDFQKMEQATKIFVNDFSMSDPKSALLAFNDAMSTSAEQRLYQGQFVATKRKRLDGLAAKPILVIHGRNDKLVSLKHASNLIAEANNAAILVLETESHAPFISHRGQVETRIADFIQSL
jgi:pimeloyl-ACP methyl ester carboxylesterase